MSKSKSSIGWEKFARLILRNRILLLVLVLINTIFLSTQWKNIRFSYSEANLMPNDHPFNIAYNDFVDVFGEEGNLLIIAVNDSLLFDTTNFNAWIKLSDSFKLKKEVNNVLHVGNFPIIKKDKIKKEFTIDSLKNESFTSNKKITEFKALLFNDFPFYENILFNKKTGTIQTAIYLDKEVINNIERIDFVNNIFIPSIKEFEKQSNLNVRISGMPYIRTMNAQNIMDEIGKFVIIAICVTIFIFFFFFRSYRATLITLSVVITGVMWALGVLGLLQFEITVLTALIPPLIIVIGVPNCIFLINKYQHEVKKHGNQARSLQRVISKIGNATLMTNITTACGFATFILTDSQVLKEFGVVASINIMVIFILSILLIPIIYSFLPLPKKKHLKHLNNDWLNSFVDFLGNTVKKRRIPVFIISILCLCISIVGMNKIEISGNLIEDMPAKSEFVRDIKFFEKEFKGVLPLEIMIDSRRKNGMTRLANLKRMNDFHEHILKIPELSSPISVVNISKYIKQSFYNGNPNYFQLPSSQENTFISGYLKNSKLKLGENNSYINETGQIARITTMIGEIDTERMEGIEASLLKGIELYFPEDRFDVSLTGKTLGYLKGTKFLIKNLLISLFLAIILISLMITYLFRSYKMVIISLVPNILPLLFTAGVMGFLNIPIKPSTILVFSIAFGISVDDTIHFLVKYRQELIANNWKIRKSVFSSLRETGISMFYTSVVLFFGFSVFMTSSYGGTIALGGLVSTTLLFAMLANLVLLPSLLISLEKNISNKTDMKEAKIKLDSD
ncbi:MMPL family transporter [Flavobacteriaceae bacterium]|jgi:predicted RND superfamily exporter protein|nr:MMPL family transporter [Flavobacteriaceae bacterium]MBT4297488.1 MMPL family transporter [Flavobacteriaceae bacterium]MBT4960003.1 MMPL family transporter [Flavobacteriaceae bacterium]MBT5232735.1 MMPL family transporter [Flavobacteriaceae bacterium]MBT6654066.1 MMPL family transporter [Flavobacteriaceae bacterium]|tara:strand:+ start:815 stop:3187 length:2373 start_codon:yes stop_codon:yes gene_type:complete